VGATANRRREREGARTRLSRELGRDSSESSFVIATQLQTATAPQKELSLELREFHGTNGTGLSPYRQYRPGPIGVSDGPTLRWGFVDLGGIVSPSHQISPHTTPIYVDLSRPDERGDKPNTTDETHIQDLRLFRCELSKVA